MDDTPKPWRLFIAIEVPAQVKAELTATQHELRRLVPGDAVRWVTPEQFHLTLRFLGGVAAERVADLVTALEIACRDFSPLELKSEGIGFFPQRGLPRVIWAGANDQSGQLALLQSAVQSVSQAFTNEEPEDRFHGHITFGRVKEIKRREAESLQARAVKLADHTFGNWLCPELQLMRSQLSPSGAKHLVQASVPLGKR